jgi:hypothetical protein
MLEMTGTSCCMFCMKMSDRPRPRPLPLLLLLLLLLIYN